MHWTVKNSIILSQVCVGVFAALLLALDIFAYPLITQLCNNVHYIGTSGWEKLWMVTNWQMAAALLAAVYVGSVFGWAALYKLFRLLQQIKKERVFEAGNVKLLRAISWCCFGAAAATLVGGAAALKLILPLLVLAAAAAFMGLIVRIVKNVFQQAIAMKSELDLTI